MLKREYIYFKPTNEHFVCKKDFDEAHNQFHSGDLTEEFMHYCAEKALHAFWVNYKDKDQKITKPEFCQKFKELINQMLKEM